MASLLIHLLRSNLEKCPKMTKKWPKLAKKWPEFKILLESFERAILRPTYQKLEYLLKKWRNVATLHYASGIWLAPYFFLFVSEHKRYLHTKNWILELKNKVVPCFMQQLRKRNQEKNEKMNKKRHVFVPFFVLYADFHSFFRSFLFRSFFRSFFVLLRSRVNGGT